MAGKMRRPRVIRSTAGRVWRLGREKCAGTIYLERRNTSSSDLGRPSGKMQPLLLLLAFLLAHEAGTEDIIGGHEAKPHSHPYKALVQFLLKDQKNRCSSVLLRKDFVLTAAHCWGSPIIVTLGAHNIQEQERTQQVIPVREAICHPDYNPKNFVNDIMLLKLERKAKQTAAVWPLSLPRGTAQVWRGQVCSVAGLEAIFNGHFSNHSAEVELTVQNDQECEFFFHGYYSRATQICVGDLKMMKNSFKVQEIAMEEKK
ncbi:granzyme H-like [Equus quagga]|uniref:granzyme H-like n=1 Tax=Equus quagga TaxID=89248 RepID=UPI001EE2C979|nr:granzyme H-like [Equus quagga]